MGIPQKHDVVLIYDFSADLGDLERQLSNSKALLVTHVKNRVNNGSRRRLESIPALIFQETALCVTSSMGVWLKTESLRQAARCKSHT
eukprot:819305-Amphidinium_carterae.1